MSEQAWNSSSGQTDDFRNLRWKTGDVAATHALFRVQTNRRTGFTTKQRGISLPEGIVAAQTALRLVGCLEVTSIGLLAGWK